MKGGCFPKEKSISIIDAFHKNIKRTGLQIHFIGGGKAITLCKELLNLGFFGNINIQLLIMLPSVFNKFHRLLFILFQYCHMVHVHKMIQMFSMKGLCKSPMDVPKIINSYVILLGNTCLSKLTCKH